MSDLIPEGRYMAVPVPVPTDAGGVYAQFGVTDSGKEQVVIQFEIAEGPEAGRRIAWFGYFTTEKGTRRTLESLRYCGWRGTDLAAIGKLELPVSITIEHDEYNGRVSAKVAWINSPNGGFVRVQNPMKPNDLKRFSSALSKVAAEIPDAPAPRMKTPAPGEREPGIDDDAF